MSMDRGFNQIIYDTTCANFVDAWIDEAIDTAVVYAQTAQQLWDQAFGERAREAVLAGKTTWPVPGCPEADETTGWAGWYGGYGGTGA